MRAAIPQERQNTERRPVVTRLSLVLVMIAWLYPVLVAGQQPAPPTGNVAAPALEDIQTARAAIEADAALPDSTKTTVLELYDQAIASIEEARRLETENASLAVRIESAPDRITEIRERLATPARDTMEDYAATPLEEVEQLVRQREAELETARLALQEKEGLLAEILMAETTLSDDIAERRSRLRSLQQDLETPAPADEPAALTEARRIALDARWRLRQAEIQLFEQQLSGHDRLVELESLERDVAANEVVRLEAEFETLEAVADVKRREEASMSIAAAEAAKAELGRLPETVRPVAERIVEQNVRLRAELEEVVRKEARVGRLLRSTGQEAIRITDDFETAKRRVEIVGSTTSIGRMLRRRLAGLPSLQIYRRSADQRREEIDIVTDRQLDLEEQRRGLADPGRRVDEIMLSSGAALLEPDTREETRQALQEMLVAQRESLAELQNLFVRYVGQLIALDVAERDLVSVADESVAFIEERLVWIRSLPPISLADMSAFPAALTWLISPVSWKGVWRDLVNTARDQIGAFSVGVLIVLGIFGWSRTAPRRLDQIAGQTRKIRSDAFLHTIRALMNTAILAAVHPAPLVLAGWLLSWTATANEFASAVGSALLATAALWFMIELLRHSCRDRGLGECHFRWPAAVRKDLYRQLGWLLFVVVPAFFVNILIHEHVDQPIIQQGLGRPLYIAIMAVVAVFFIRFLGSRSAVTDHLRDKRANHWTAQLRFLWYPLLLAMIIAHAALSAVGYHYAAVQLDHRVHATAWFLIGVFFLREMLLRWLYVRTRRLRFDEAVRRREEAREKKVQGDIAESVQGELLQVEVPEVSYNELSEKARRLLEITVLFGIIAGLWAIWQNLVPTFGFLDAVNLPLFGVEIIDGVETRVPITLWDVVVALFILAIAVVAAKNLSGLLEIALLQRLPLESGGRYAIVTLCQYSIVAIGVISAFSTIGVQWSSIQWLVAALGVGLGFGLQEIVANFISGIILLIERPIRVGDIVTVGDTSGVVSRIRIRATTIVNWDKQELVVPNKELITGRLLNWTLTDKLNRIVINVGIAYKADVEKALALMAEAADENENILEDPEPVITFEGFGDNVLHLVLRCYLDSLNFRLMTISELNEAINRKFREAGIVIAFPQRDVHLDMKQPIDVRLNPAVPEVPMGNQLRARRGESM